MNQPRNENEHRQLALEQAGLDAMNTMASTDGLGWYREHVAAGCEVCQSAAIEIREVFEELLLGAPPVMPPRDLKSKVLGTILGTAKPDDGTSEESVPDQSWAETEDSKLKIVHTSNAWLDGTTPGVSAAVEGVFVRTLHHDVANDRITMLVRMEPGVSYPEHRHAGDEECDVIAGDLRVEDHVLQAGDYQRAPKGSVHGVQSTETGCTLLIVCSQHDEILT